jgi:hypothetical protein
MALYLRARDISFLILSCRRLHNIVVVQYACRTELAGVCDSLHDLSRYSIVNCMESLRRWERRGEIWEDTYLLLPRPGSSYPQRLAGTCSALSSSAKITCSQSHPTGLRQPALLYVDLRNAIRTGQRNWKKIDYPKDSIAITQAFSIEEDDLVVSVLR